MNNFKNLSKKEKAEYIAMIAIYPLFLLFAQLGKVCKLFGTKKRQITASILCAAMILTMLPVMSLTAFAAEPAPTPTPLTFTAEEDDSTVTLNFATGTNVQYQKGNVGWVNYTAGTPITLDDVNNTVSFRGTGVTANDSNHFNMTGKIAASGDVTSLTNGAGGDATLSYNCYQYMFKDCTSLTAAPELPATTLEGFCYYNMFYGCTSLTAPPELPARIMRDSCYNGMFRGCTSLTAPPELPATIMVDNCYYDMFYGCTSLKISTTLIDNYTKAWCIPSKGYSYNMGAVNWNYNMLFGTGGTFTKNPGLDTTYYIYEEPTPLTFTAESNDSSVTLNYATGTDVKYQKGNDEWADYEKNTPIELDENETVSFIGTGVTTDMGAHFFMKGAIAASGHVTSLTNGVGGNAALTSNCYYGMFQGCTSLTTAPILPAATLADGCYSSMFLNCASLTTAPKLSATTLADACYSSMFTNCTSLTAAPKLPAATLAPNCYYSMFTNCTSLTTAPELPARTLASYCYTNMFQGCVSLTIPPNLPSIKMTPCCYSGMFTNCTSLITAPRLPATTLASTCYSSMFYGCKSLTMPPELPATTLADACYSSMFYGCKSLTMPPELPATTLAENCYKCMLFDCTSLKVSTTPGDNFSKEWRIPTKEVITATEFDWNYNMLLGTGGTFCGSPEINTAYYIYEEPTIPEGIPLTFTAVSNDSSVTLNYATGTDVKYQKGNDGWVKYIKNTPIELDENETVSFIGTGVTTDMSAHFFMKGAIAASGHVTSLTNGVGGDADLTSNCYDSMFYGCKSLTTAPRLPATTLADSCYRYMFYNCTSLETAPELPATTLADFCYYSMFYGCKSLTTAPELPATTLAPNCYYSMFYGCTSLETAPELPATTLADFCYYSMFYGCKSLTAAPKLPAATLAPNCYYSMFNNCTSLTTAPELPATTLADGCYYSMFNNCTSLTTAPELPATTLTPACYSCMFYNCTGLKEAPKLPATTLANSCYSSMFYNCTSLTTAPNLPATALIGSCYYKMFYGCTGLKISTTKTDNFTKEWRIPSAGTIATTASEWNYNMLSGTGGTFTGNPAINTIYYFYEDTTAPVISGIEDGKSYCGSAEFTISDEDLNTVTVNGNTVTASEGKYTLTDTGTHTVVATDKSGNSTTITVTLNANHIWATSWSSDGTNHWYECSVCGEKKDSAAHTPNADDGDCTTAIHCSVCGAVTTAAEGSHDFTGAYDGYDANYHWHICNNDGCTETDAKEAHSGGTADYFHKAVCTACGQEYGTTTADVTAPTNLKIQYNKNGFKSFLNTITFGIFFKETVTVTASAEDSESGVASVQYFASDTEIADFTSVTWQNSLTLTPNSKKIVYVKATDNAGNTSVVNYEGVVVYSDSKISPATATFDKNVANQADVAFTMTLNGNTLKDIKNGTTVLTSGTDYTVNGNTVTVKKAYLAAQANGTVQLTFSFYPMGVKNNENLSTATATVTVSDTTHHHSLTHTVAKSATCTADGNVEYWYCSACKKYFSDANGNNEITNIVTAKLGHNMSHTAAVAATCTADGNVEYWYCSACKKYFSDANGNTEITKTVTSKLGHNMSHTAAVAATCTADGNVEYWHCSTCNKNFSDENGNTEITKTVISKLGHTWDNGEVTTEPTVTQKGEKTYTCTACGETKTEDIPMLTPSIIDGVKASYTVGGEKDLVFKSNAALADFISVSVDGVVIDSKNYTTAEGSTIVALTADYLATLSVGTHTLDINSTSGTASTEFTIAENPNNSTKPSNTKSPQTGSKNSIVLLAAIMFVFAGVLSTFEIKKKRKNNSAK